MSKQPEALRLADVLDDVWHGGIGGQEILSAAEELRRLHEANAELLEALNEGVEWTQEFVSQMRSYTISDEAAESLTRQLATIAKHGGQ